MDPRSADSAIELQARSWALQAEGRLAEAFETCLAALRLMEACEGPESPDVANLLADAAEIAHERGHHAAALECAERAASIARGWRCVATDETVARLRLRILTLVGSVLRTLGDYPRAEPPLREAMTIATEVFGAASAEHAQAQNDLGVLCKYAGRFEEGLALYQGALATLQTLHGDDSLACADVYHNLGGLLHARGDFAAAEVPARRAWETSRRVMGDAHLRTLRDAVAYAAILDGVGRADESEPIYRTALSFYEHALGPDHEEVAATAHNLAAALASRGDTAGAEGYYRRALATKVRVFGADHPEVALTCNNLGRLLADAGRPAEGIALLERAIVILGRRLDPGHPHLAAARGNLSRALLARGT